MANTTGKKFGGRKKGTLNKVTYDIRLKYSMLIDNNFDRLQEDIDSLPPLERIKVIIDLSKFVVPTLKTTEINNSEINEPRKVVIDFRE